MPKYGVKIKNLDKFTKALSQYPQIARKYFARAIENATYQLQRASKRRTPVDTGLLRDTIYALHSPIEGKVIPAQEYAPYVHEGTYKMKARPFLKWGMEDADKEIQNTFERELENTMKEIARRT